MRTIHASSFVDFTQNRGRAGDTGDDIRRIENEKATTVRAHALGKNPRFLASIEVCPPVQRSGCGNSKLGLIATCDR